MLVLNQPEHGSAGIRASDTQPRIQKISSERPITEPEFRGTDDGDDLNRLINVWRGIKDRRAMDFSYHTHLRYHILQLDHAQMQISPGRVHEDLISRAAASSVNTTKWSSTHAACTIEATRLRPLTPQLSDLLSIEPNLMQQRQCLEDVLDEIQGCFTTNAFLILPSTNAAPHMSSDFRENCGRSLGDLRLIFNAHDLREARYLHDQFCVLGPITFALTATDPGWHNSQPRQRAKSGHNLAKADYQSTKEQPKHQTAFSSRPVYLSADAPESEVCRDGIDQKIFWRLRREGLDDTLATLFAQDASSPIRSSQLSRSSSGSGDHYQFFDRLTELNRHVRLQLPLLEQPQSSFRVEFSGINAQLADFAHAACISFVALLRFAILGFDLDFRIPPEKAAENIKQSQTKDAVGNARFWWRMPRWRVRDLHPFSNDQYITTDQEPVLVSIDHIVNGDPARPETIGLSGVVEAYLADTEDDGDIASLAQESAPAQYSSLDLSPISNYLAFIRTRAKGTTWTDARWIDTFVRGHRESGDDQIVNDKVLYHLFSFVRDFTHNGSRN